MSLVESCPSTETRSNERATHTPSSRSAVSARQRRVGLDEAEHRRERGRDHPRALGLRGQPHGAGRQRDVDLDLLGELVRGADRLGEVAVAVLAQLAARPGDPADRLAGVQRHADHAGGGDRDLVLGRAAGHRRRALHARRVLEAAVAGGGVGVAGVGHDHAQRVQPRALLGQHDRRGQHARAREARRATRSPATSRPSGPRSIPPRRLEAAGHARGAEARREVARVLGHVRRAAPASVSSPADPPSQAGRTSGSGSARPATPRPSTGCRSPRRR